MALGLTTMDAIIYDQSKNEYDYFTIRLDYQRCWCQDRNKFYYVFVQYICFIK